MPPWPPQGGYGAFQDERRLTAEEIDLLARWVRAGSLEGDPRETPSLPQFPGGWQLGIPDLVLTASRAFTLPAAGADVFWNFLYQPDLKRPRFVRAMEIRTGVPKAVHHANLLVDRTGSVRRLERVPGAGFSGMEMVVDRNPSDPESHFLFWKPGSILYSEPPGLAWGLGPGNVLVLNTHMQPTGKPELVAPTIGLYFTDDPPSKFPILIQLAHDGALNIPAGAKHFLVSDDFKLPVDAQVLAVYPHAHYLGKLLEGYATLPDGSRRWLIRIPDWNLQWQAVYRYKAPVALPKGSVISMRFYYDNSSSNPRNPNHPPHRVRAGNQATDEMGHLWLQILPVGTRDRRREIQEAIMRHRLEKYPNDFSAHLNLGAIMLSRLDAQGAVSMLEEAVRIDDSRAEAHDMLGSALLNLGRSADATAQFRIALRVQPDYINARYNLAGVLAHAGKLSEAVQNFRKVADAYPDSSRLQGEYAELLAKNGDYAEALERFDKAVALDPQNTAAKEEAVQLRRQLSAR